MAYTKGGRQKAAEMADRDAGVPIFEIYFTSIAPIQHFDDDGIVNSHVCAPYISLADPHLTAEKIRRMQPYIASLIPRKGKTRVGIFLALEHFDDNELIDELRGALPRGEVFNCAQHPGYKTIMTDSA